MFPGTENAPTPPQGRRRPVRRVALFGALALVASGCSELQARRHARTGNAYFKDSEYAAAIREYDRADALAPGLYAVTLNRGLACRELMLMAEAPGDRERAVECAVTAFSRLKELRPDDPRAYRLLAQTLFDAQRFEQLAALYEARLEQKPDDAESIDGLIQLHSRMNRWGDTLRWAVKRARAFGGDAEAQYTIGVMIYNRLFQKRSAIAAYDPRSDANLAKSQPFPDPGSALNQRSPSDNLRLRLAAVGIKYLNRTIELRPEHRAARAFLELMRRSALAGEYDEPADAELLEQKWLLDEELPRDPFEIPNGDPPVPGPGDHPVAPATGVPV